MRVAKNETPHCVWKQSDNLSLHRFDIKSVEMLKKRMSTCGFDMFRLVVLGQSFVTKDSFRHSDRFVPLSHILSAWNDRLQRDLATLSDGLNSHFVADERCAFVR